MSIVSSPVPAFARTFRKNAFKQQQLQQQQRPCRAFDRQTGTFSSDRLPLIRDDPWPDVVSFIFSSSAVPPQIKDKVALLDGITGSDLTFGRTHEMIFRVAARLRLLGVQPGDVVVVLSPNSILYPVAMLSIWSLGAIAATPNPLGTPEEVEQQARLANAKFAFTVKELLHKVETMDLPTMLLDDDSNDGERRNSAVLAVTKPVEIRPEDPAAVLYSSGTTGISKGVVISHRNIISQILQLEDATSSGGSSSLEQVHLCALPMSHVFGSVVVTLRQLHSGFTTVVLPGFELKALVKAIHSHRVSHLYVVPPLVVILTKTLLQNRGLEIERLQSLRSIFCGAAPLGRDLIAACARLLPRATFTQIYGLTECTGAATLVSNGSKEGSVGTLLSQMEAKVMDVSSSNSLPPNREGELVIRGPTTMTGYMNDPKSSSLALSSDGWLRTGDLVYFDDQGHLFVVDRIKELIKYKALQVAPAELEAVLLSHPQIQDAAVVPFDREDVGQIPMAFVVQTPEGQLTEDDVKAFVSQRVAPYKRVRRVAFTNVIAKTSSGKILRKELIKQIQKLE